MVSSKEIEDMYSIHKLTFGFTNTGMSTISEELVKNIIFNKIQIIQSEIPIEIIIDNTNINFMLNLKD